MNDCRCGESIWYSLVFLLNQCCLNTIGKRERERLREIEREKARKRESEREKIYESKKHILSMKFIFNGLNFRIFCHYHEIKLES